MEVFLSLLVLFLLASFELYWVFFWMEVIATVWPHRSNFPLLGKFLIPAAVIGWVAGNLIGWKVGLEAFDCFLIWRLFWHLVWLFLIEFLDFEIFVVLTCLLSGKCFLTQGWYTNAHDSWRIRDCYKTLGPICLQIKNFRTTIKWVKLKKYLQIIE